MSFSITSEREVYFIVMLYYNLFMAIGNFLIMVGMLQVITYAFFDTGGWCYQTFFSGGGNQFITFTTDPKQCAKEQDLHLAQENHLRWR